MPSMTRTTIFFWTVLLFLLPVALSAPTAKDSTCKNPVVRREWRTLSRKQRDKFHKAVKCLQTKPSIVESDGVTKTLYDDFAYAHFSINQTIHKVASFFPWHRYFLLIRERELSKCGYEDPIPYWDWTRESTADDFVNSDLFDPKKGFGGNGVLEQGPDGQNTTCVQDGPYANLEVNFPEPHCLARSFNVTDQLASNWTSANVKRIMEYPDYLHFWNETERQPHDNVHRAVSGDMRRQFSPNEPLFFIHHAQVDRLWTLWQGRNETRFSDYAGNRIQNMTINDVGLKDEMYMVGLAENRTVDSLMDTLSNGLCYTYDDAEWDD